jgi:hypothetical protein
MNLTHNATFTQQNNILIKQLLDKINNLERRVEYLESNKSLQKKAKPINVFKWLNSKGAEIKNKTYQDYNFVFEKLEWIKPIYLTFICRKGSVIGYSHIILNKLKENIFVAFKSRKKIFYFNGKKWKIFTLEKLIHLIRKINRHMLGLFLDWTSQEQISQDKYNEYSKHILGGDTRQRKKNAVQIYGILWNKLKKDSEKSYNVRLSF